MVIASLFDRAYEVLLSPRVRERAEKSILVIAIFGFLVHLLLIALADFGVLTVGADSKLLSNPIVATYTPFSFIIVYEVYMLVYYLPRSITPFVPNGFPRLLPPTTHYHEKSPLVGFPHPPCLVRRFARVR